MWLKQLFFISSVLFALPSSIRGDDSFRMAQIESDNEIARGGAPVWVGGFILSCSTDEELYVQTSSRNGFVYRKRSIFGFEKTIVVPITIVEDELRSEVESREYHSPHFNHPLVIAKVEDCVFLIPKGRVHGFCINLREGNGLDSYLHSKDRPNLRFPKASGIKLPTKYEYLVDIPRMRMRIERVIQLTKDKMISVEARVENGAKPYLGMELTGGGSVFEITEINADIVIATSVVNMEQSTIEKLPSKTLATSTL